jgi:GDPmannose 4,6-dehydratase
VRKFGAIIVGSEGQDGRILFDALAAQGRKPLGIARGRMRSESPWRRSPVDILRAREVFELVRDLKPAEVYYLAAFNHSSTDRLPDNVELLRRSHEAHVAGTLNFLEAIRLFSPATRLFYAASSHVFGRPKTRVQNERSPLAPETIYGVTKAAGLLACGLYRRRYGVFASAGILYNHEHGPGFVSRKIIQGVADILNGRCKELILGDLNATADWGYAPDYVEAMQAILRHDAADDFVVAGGKGRSVRQYARTAFSLAGLDWRSYVKEDPRLLTRKTAALVGDARKLKRLTGWRPRVTFERMIAILLAAEGVRS